MSQGLEDRNPTHIQDMFNRIAPRYRLLNTLLSLNQDVRWRRALLRQIPLDKTGAFLDLACGTGEVLFRVAKLCTQFKSYWGIDLSPGMLKQAARDRSYINLQSQLLAIGKSLELKEGTAEMLPFPDSSIDCVSMAFGIRNVARRDKAISEIYRVLNEKGTLLILDFFPVHRGLGGTLFAYYFWNVLPKISGFFSDEQAYRYLSKSVDTMPQNFEQTLTQSGFRVVRQKTWLWGAVRLFAAEKLEHPIEERVVMKESR